LTITRPWFRHLNLGVNRGYLSNAEEVRVFGAEMDGNIRIHDNLLFYGALSYTSGEYVSFTNAPVPLEEVGGEQAFKDISGGRLPGISRWAGSFGGELSTHELKLLTIPGNIFLGLDAFFRSGFSSSPSPSRYLNVEGYAVLMYARLGFREEKGLSYFFWVRNLLNQEYFEQLLVASGSAGHYAGVLGDPATFGISLGYSF
jgi:iron complex outermembrane recepter protein